MAERPVAFTTEAAREIAEAARQVKAGARNRPVRSDAPQVVTPVVVLVRVTSATPAAVDNWANAYPAKIAAPDHTTGSFTDLGDCYVIDPNNL